MLNRFVRMRSIKKIINRVNRKGLKIGIWEFYDENGRLTSKGSYKDGVMVGKWKFYHLNGKIRSKGEYVDNDKEGIWEFYGVNGELESKELYCNGVYLRDV